MRHWTRDPLAVGVAALAAYRLTRLVTTDTLPPLEAARTWAEDQLTEKAPDWAHGVTCPWCVSVWAAAAVTALTEVGHRRRSRAVDLVLFALAASATSGVLADLEPH